MFRNELFMVSMWCKGLCSVTRLWPSIRCRSFSIPQCRLYALHCRAMFDVLASHRQCSIKCFWGVLLMVCMWCQKLLSLMRGWPSIACLKTHTLDSVSCISFIHSAISIVPLQVLYYSEALPTTPHTVSEFHAEAHRQLQVKDLPKVPTWRLERESNPRPSGWKSPSQPGLLTLLWKSSGAAATKI